MKSSAVFVSVLGVAVMVSFSSQSFSAKLDQKAAMKIPRQLEREILGKDGAPMVLVPAGEFTMGDNSYNNLEQRVYLDDFYMDKFELTTIRYVKFIQATGRQQPYEWSDVDLAQYGDRPVIGVDWHDADEYCRWAGKFLPNEAEWEKAARGTDGRSYPWGNQEPTRALASFDWDGGRKWLGYQTLSPVGSYEAGKSPYGIYNMAGNVWEWVAEWYSNKTSTRSSEDQNQKGLEKKVVRGGSWANDASNLRSAYWFRTHSALRIHCVGFRCAQDAPK